MSQNKDYKYFILFSEQDYPIKAISYIKTYLENVYLKLIIDCTYITKYKWIRLHPYYRFVERITKNEIIRKIILLPIYFFMNLYIER